MKTLRGLYKWPFVLYRWGKWYYRHGINDFEYAQEEKEYLTRRKLMISERNWLRHTQVYKGSDESGTVFHICFGIAIRLFRTCSGLQLVN